MASSASAPLCRLYEGGGFVNWVLCAIPGVMVVFWGKFGRVRRAHAQGQACAAGGVCRSGGAGELGVASNAHLSIACIGV